MAPREVRYPAGAWGVGRLWLDGARLLAHELPRPSREAAVERHPLAERIEAYFDGCEVDFGDVVIDVGDATRFSRAVTAALRAVPYGTVLTYGELAALAGHPGASRAVGSFCARNRFPLVVPCHRVVAAGGVGPYGSLGAAYKRALLALEGVSLGEG